MKRHHTTKVFSWRVLPRSVASRGGCALASRTVLLGWGLLLSVVAGVWPIDTGRSFVAAQDSKKEDAPSKDAMPSDTPLPDKDKTTRSDLGVLPKLEEMAVPPADELLRARPFDWIVLKSQDVIVVDAVAPRPDPVQRLTYRHKVAETQHQRLLKYRGLRRDDLVRLRNLEKDKGAQKPWDDQIAELDSRVEASRVAVDERQKAILHLAVSLRDDTVDPDYTLDTRGIHSIVHFEDLILRRADLLINEGRIPVAYDLLMIVERRHRANNDRFRLELEDEKKNAQDKIAALEETRTKRRAERVTLVRMKKRVEEVDMAIVSLGSEIDEWKADLVEIDRQLGIPKAWKSPNPPALRKDDLLLPYWPNFEETFQRLIFKDAEQHSARNDHEGALRLLEGLWHPQREVPGLRDRLGQIVDVLVSGCVDVSDFRRARHYWHRLASRDAAHPIAEKWKTTLTELASRHLTEAREQAQRGDNLLATASVDRAARVWPDTPGLKEAHREQTLRGQSLRMGVLTHTDASAGYPFLSVAEERIRRLTLCPLFEPARVDDRGIRYRSPFVETWEPTDLGRQVTFNLRLKRLDRESRSLVTAVDFAGELTRRIDPQHPSYDERLAGMIESVAVHSPSVLTVRFRSLPLRMESYWQFTIGLQDETRLLNGDLLSANSDDAGRTRFQKVSADDRQASFVRSRRQPTTNKQRFVDEVIEVKYNSWEASLQGLMRGEVTALAQVDLRDLKPFQEDQRFLVVPYAAPLTHFLQFEPSNRALRDGQLRRALLHAIPRKRLLDEVVLKGVGLRDLTVKDVALKQGSSHYGRLVTSPFAASNYGYNRNLEQPVYDPHLAAALAATAKKQLGGTLPVLRLTCPRDRVAQVVARQMIEHWRIVGITVKLVNETDASDDVTPDKPLVQQTSAKQEPNAKKVDQDQAPQSDSDPGWDICYRTTKLIEPLTDFWPLLTQQSVANVAGLQPLPDRTRRALVELERANDWASVLKQLHKLQSDLLVEARYIPLWEIDEFLVTRRHLSGLPSRLVHTYDDIERWALQSWYPTETP